MDDVLGFGKLGMALLKFLGDEAGYIFEPQHIKRLATASAEAAKKAAETAPEGSIIVIDDGKVKIKTSGKNIELPNQVANLVQAELHKQENIDSIVDKALELLEAEKDQEKPVDLNGDWLNHFFDDSKLASDKEMQDLWARILSKECVKKGSFSIRTMELLRGLSKEEAKIFTECCKNSFGYGSMRILISIESLQGEYGLNLIEIMRMNDCGLINDSGKSLTFQKGSTHTFVKDKLVYVYQAGQAHSFSINAFSEVGQELSALVQEKKPFSDEQIKAIFSKQSIDTITVHNLIDDEHYDPSILHTIS